MSARRFRGLLSVTGRSRGSSLVELALVLPILLILVLGVIDFGRALQFNNVLIAMSREGANLAARTTADPQAIITALVVSSHPVDMPGVGMIYVSSFSGQANGQGVLQSQARYGGGNLSLASRIYNCSGWSSSNCLVPKPAPAVSLPIALQDGEVVHVVEVVYNFVPITGFVWTSARELYSETVL